MTTKESLEYAIMIIGVVMETSKSVTEFEETLSAHDAMVELLKSMS